MEPAVLRNATHVLRWQGLLKSIPKKKYAYCWEPDLEVFFKVCGSFGTSSCQRVFLADVGPRHDALEEKQGAQMEHVAMKSVIYGCEICDFWVLWG